MLFIFIQNLFFVVFWTCYIFEFWESPYLVKIFVKQDQLSHLPYTCSALYNCSRAMLHTGRNCSIQPFSSWANPLSPPQHPPPPHQRHHAFPSGWRSISVKGWQLIYSGWSQQGGTLPPPPQSQLIPNWSIVSTGATLRLQLITPFFWSKLTWANIIHRARAALVCYQRSCEGKYCIGKPLSAKPVVKWPNIWRSKHFSEKR